MKAFKDVWRDIQIILKPGQQIQTICQRSVNDIIEVSPDGVRVSSRRSKSGKVRLITKDDFEYLWKILSKKTFTLCIVSQKSLEDAQLPVQFWPNYHT